MSNERCSILRCRSSRFVWVIGAVVLLSLLSVSAVTHAAAALPDTLPPQDARAAPALQSTATPAATIQVGPTATYSFTLAALDYGESTLDSPYDRADYSFRLPEGWVIQEDGVLDLDLSYVYNQINAEAYPALFGDVTVALDGETLEIFALEERELERYRLQVALPLSMLAGPGSWHTISILFDAGFLCEVPHQAKLVIHPSSSVTLSYSQHPLELDLSRYPRPFYQQAFESDSVRFVLPAQLSTDGLASDVLAVAAKLGSLTGDRLVISATTDIELDSLLSADPTAFDEHLIVMGRPQDNQLIPRLNDTLDMPVSLHQQQLDFVAQGPAAVAPGDTVSYLFTVTNTMDRDVELSVIDVLPAYTEFVDCAPDCAQDGDARVVSWDAELLEPDEAINLSLTLQAADVLTGTELDNTVTVLETEAGPTNAGTLMTTVVADSSGSQPRVLAVEAGDYFFVYDDKAVAEGDGIVQEVLSPWSPNRAILIITGLSDEAVRKASQAMSSEARFPGMSGPVALVRSALLPSEVSDPTPVTVEVTFEDMGYGDQVIYGATRQSTSYWFDLPPWQPSDDASIDLYFSHSELIIYEDSGLTLLLNGDPIASVALSDETAKDGHAHISLANVKARSGRSNRLSVQVDMALPGGVCANPNSEEAWFLIQDRSKVFWPRGVVAQGLGLDLSYFPYPFHTNRALTDVLFALPESPAVGDWENALRLMASLGNYASGQTTLPAALIGHPTSVEDLRDFHIIAIGRPSRNALIQEINDLLPQPFMPGLDEIEQRLDDVVFRLPPGLDLGYLQLIPSPWNETRAFLSITGTTDGSVGQAARVLADSPWRVNGDLALITDDRVSNIDTRGLVSGGVAMNVVAAVPEMTPAAATETPTTSPTPTTLLPSPTSITSESEPVSNGSERPDWLVPLIVVNGAVIIGVLVIAGLRSRRKR